MVKFKLLETGTSPLIVHGAGKSQNGEVFQKLKNELFKNPPTHMGNDSDITIITWKGGKYENQDTLLEQVARYYGFPLVIMKDWPRHANFWEGTRTKITQALDAINSGRVGTKYVMWLDVGDILLLEHPTIVLEKYLELFEGKLVWNAERNHFPKSERLNGIGTNNINLEESIKRKYVDEVFAFDESKDYTTFKYMNTGAAIGQTEHLKKFLEYAVNTPLCGYEHHPPLTDQLILRLAQSDNRDYVLVDDLCKLFVCFWNGRTALTHPELEGMSPAEHTLDDIQIY